MRRNRHTLLAGAALCCALSAEAAVLDWLYEVEAPVPSRTPADRHAAAQQALDTMLTRLTGLVEVPREPAIAAALAAPERYYQRYSFVAEGGETRLAVSFAPQALHKLIAEAALPIWAADRPVALAWVVVAGDDADTPEPAGGLEPDGATDGSAASEPLTAAAGAATTDAAPTMPLEPQERTPAHPNPAPDDGASEPASALPLPTGSVALLGRPLGPAQPAHSMVLSSASRHPVAVALRRRASERGIEIRLPLYDLEDRDRILPATLWRGYAYTIRQASARYQPDYIILGQARRAAAGTWLTDWQLWFDDAELPLQLETPDAATSAMLAVDAAGDELASRFAVTGAASSFVELEVLGANSVAGYAGLLRHLAGLAYLDRVELTEATANAIKLRVATRSSREQLGNLLAASNAFALATDAPAPANGEPMAPLRLLWTAASIRAQTAHAATQRRR